MIAPVFMPLIPFLLQHERFDAEKEEHVLVDMALLSSDKDDPNLFDHNRAIDLLEILRTKYPSSCMIWSMTVLKRLGIVKSNLV